MIATYPFTIEADGLFPLRKVNEKRLDYEIRLVPALVAKFLGLLTVQGNCEVRFASVLSAGEETQLSNVVLSHDGSESAGTSVSSNVPAITNSVSYLKVPDVELTPVAGTYRVSFGTSVAVSGKNDGVDMAIAIDGVIITSSIRRIHRASLAEGLSYPVNIDALVSVNGSQVIDARWRSVKGSSVTCFERSIIVTVSI